MHNPPFAIDALPNMSSMLSTNVPFTIFDTPTNKGECRPSHIALYFNTSNVESSNFPIGKIDWDIFFPERFVVIPAANFTVVACWSLGIIDNQFIRVDVEILVTIE